MPVYRPAYRHACLNKSDVGTHNETNKASMYGNFIEEYDVYDRIRIINISWVRWSMVKGGGRNQLRLSISIFYLFCLGGGVSAERKSLREQEGLINHVTQPYNQPFPLFYGHNKNLERVGISRSQHNTFRGKNVFLKGSSPIWTHFKGASGVGKYVYTQGWWRFDGSVSKLGGGLHKLFIWIKQTWV